MLFLASLRWGSGGTRSVVEAMESTRDSLNGGTKHCRDVCTGIDQVSARSASRLFVNRSSL